MKIGMKHKQIWCFKILTYSIITFLGSCVWDEIKLVHSIFYLLLQCCKIEYALWLQTDLS